MKASKLNLLVGLPIIVGIGLLIAGMVMRNSVLTYCAIGIMFGGSLLVAVIMIIVMWVSAGRNSDSPANTSIATDTARSSASDESEASDTEEDAPEKIDEAGEEERMLREVNSSYGYSSRVSKAEYEIEHMKRASKHTSKGDKVKGGLFFGLLIADFILIPIFFIKRIFVGGYICFGLFFFGIIGALVVVKIKERLSMSKGAVDPNKFDRKTGIVKACVISSSTSSGSHTVRIGSVTYRVVFDVDGKTYNAYSRKFYNTGERVELWVKKNGSTVRIIENETFGTDGESYSAMADEYNRRVAESAARSELDTARTELAQSVAAVAAAKSSSESSLENAAIEQPKASKKAEEALENAVAESPNASEKADITSVNTEIESPKAIEDTDKMPEFDAPHEPDPHRAVIGYKGIKRK